MARLRLRALWRNIHMWIGLALFLVFAPLGVTGSLLVFDEDIDRLLHPQRYAASGPAALPAGAYLEAARAAFGDRAQPSQLRLPGRPGQAVTVTGAVGGARSGPPAQLTAWLDPATGRALDVGNPRSELRGYMHQLHGNLFLAQSGRRLVGWMGVAMTLSCISGLIIWWPRSNRLGQALRWRRSPSGWSNLHHMVGFWVLVPLTVLSITGAAIGFPEVVRGLSGAPAPQGRGPGGPGGPAGRPALHTRLTADQAVQAAVAVAGPARLQQVILPAQGDRPLWRIQLRGPAGVLQAQVDDGSGEARVRPAGPQGPGGGDPLMRAIRQIHDGDDTGALWQAIIVVAGLAPAVLGVTGAVLWLIRRRPRAA